MTRQILLVGLALLLSGLGATVQAGPAATQPANASVADVRIQSLKPYSYVYVSTRTTLATLQDAIARLLPRIDAAIDAGKVHVEGPVVFTYHGATADRTKTFTLDIGVIVTDGGTAPEGMKLIKVGGGQCATLVCAGPVSELQRGYEKLYREIFRRGLQPTDVSREVYLYWEEEGSENNLVQIQVELAPVNQEGM